MKKIAIVMSVCALFVCVLLSSFKVTCVNETTVWAIKPRATVMNVDLMCATPGDQFRYKGSFQDASGEEWYFVSGVQQTASNAGLSEGYILKSDCKWSLFN